MIKSSEFVQASAVAQSSSSGSFLVMLMMGGAHLFAVAVAPLLLVLTPVTGLLMTALFVVAFKQCRQRRQHPWLIGLGAIIAVMHLGLAVFSGYWVAVVWKHGMGGVIPGASRQRLPCLCITSLRTPILPLCTGMACHLSRMSRSL